MTLSFPPVATRRALTAPGTVVLLLVAAGAWLLLARLPMSGMDSVADFVPAWTLMMVAMMLPAVAPVASLWSHTIKAGRVRRLALFALGYLLAWALTAVPAYGGWLLVEQGLTMHPLAARVAGAAVFATAGLYQLTPYKQRCLRHCRSPLGQLMRYSSWQRRGRDLLVGLHHAGYCLGCCWALMLLLFALGAMTIGAALGLAALVVTEKLTPRGEHVARAAGFIAVAWAVVVAVHPAAAPGLTPMASMPASG